MFGCDSSPLGGGIRTGLPARNEFTGPDLLETISPCGLHTFRVAARPPWASAHHTQLLEVANEIQDTFYRTHAFYLFDLSPVDFFTSPLPLPLSVWVCFGLCLTCSDFSFFFFHYELSPIRHASCTATGGGWTRTRSLFTRAVNRLKKN